MSTRSSILVCVFSILYLINGVISADPKFPKFSELTVEDYTTEVQVTDQNEQDSAYATELYDIDDRDGKLYVIVEKQIIEIFYFNETNEIIEVNDTTCLVWGIDESEYGLEDIFWGWHHPDPLVIGPSALLFLADDNRDKIKYAGQNTIRDIPLCDTFTLEIVNKEGDNVTIYYYFAPTDWITPYNSEKKFRVPLRIHVLGETSKNVQNNEKVPVDIVNDYAFFKPLIDDETELQPPTGLGCQLKENSERMPKIPNTFRYNAEVVDLYEASQSPDPIDVKSEILWYDYDQKIARFDIYKKTTSLRSFQDYNTGVMFNFYKGQDCKIEPLENAEFEKHAGDFWGTMKTPEEVLSLTGDFYEMGQHVIRGVTCDTFESVEYDYTTEDGLDYYKFVVTVHFTEDTIKIGIDSFMGNRIPILITLTGWSDYKTITYKKQYSISFFNKFIWKDMYRNFQIDKCFPEGKRKTYFGLIINPPDKTDLPRMEKEDNLIVKELRSQIVSYANIPDWRIPLLRIDYTSSGVYAEGLMLDRPPILMQFEDFGKEDHVTMDKYMEIADVDGTLEDCGSACIDSKDCTGFYLCDALCYLKGESPLATHDDTKDGVDLGVCYSYEKLDKDSSNEHNTPLKKALESLENAVNNQNLSVIVIKEGDDDFDTIPVSQIIIGQGPYTGLDSSAKPYNVAVLYRSLKKEKKTSTAFNDVDLLYTCYKECESLGSACSSFSFCSRTKKPNEVEVPKCIISSELFVNGKVNETDMIETSYCDIYDLKFLEYYEKYPEIVSYMAGYKIVSDVKSAEDCAKNCRLEGKTENQDQQICRGFEYCEGTKLCSLHTKHILDLKPHEKTSKPITSKCIHYAARFVADYDNKGAELLDDNTNVKYQLSLEECAKKCSQELGDDCKSFNYCPTDTSCALSGKVLTTPGVTTTTKDKCMHYEKRADVLDWTKKTKEKKVPSTGYTKKGFTGLVIGMLALGLIIGVIGFVGYSWWKSKRYGEGVSVRFMKQET